MTRITISLRESEKSALRVLAERQFRDPRAQAALIIRRELERYGLLETESEQVTPSSIDKTSEDEFPQGGYKSQRGVDVAD